MKYIPGSPSSNSRLFGLLIRPSWLSGITVSLLSVLFCLGIILTTRFQASSIRVDFLNYQAGQLAQLHQQVNNDLLSNTYLSNLPLLVFWGLVGIAVYLFIVNTLAVVKDTAVLTSELHYVHANRRELLFGSIGRLFMRLVVVGIWLLYALFFLHHIVPYSIAASIVASAYFQVWQATGYAVLAVIIMAVALHVHTVLLRLFLQRPRLLSAALYADIEASEL